MCDANCTIDHCLVTHRPPGLSPALSAHAVAFDLQAALDAHIAHHTPPMPCLPPRSTLFGLALSNLGVVPAEAPHVYGVVNAYLLPLAVPLLLFSADLRWGLSQAVVLACMIRPLKSARRVSRALLHAAVSHCSAARYPILTKAATAQLTSPSRSLQAGAE